MRGIFLRENREVPTSLEVDGTTAGRIGKAGGHAPMMHDGGKSDRRHFGPKWYDRFYKRMSSVRQGKPG